MDASVVANAPAWWLLSLALMLIGIAGTVLPMLPGPLLVFGGALLGAWIDGFERVSGWTVGLIALLAILAWVTDFVAALLGARRVGASRLALVGAAAGTVLGVLSGFIGLLFMPLAGAMLGEYWTQQQRLQAGATRAEQGAAGQQAAKVGLATWIGLLIGTVVKLVLSFLMVGVFALAYWL